MCVNIVIYRVKSLVCNLYISGKNSFKTILLIIRPNDLLFFIPNDMFFYLLQHYGMEAQKIQSKRVNKQGKDLCAL